MPATSTDRSRARHACGGRFFDESRQDHRHRAWWSSTQEHRNDTHRSFECFGSPAAGVLYATFGARPAFALNAASFLVSAAVLARLRLPRTAAPTARRGWFADAVAGARLVVGDRLLRALGAGQLLAALSAGATSALLVVLARDHLGLPASGYGLLPGAIGVGAVLGPLLLTRLVSNPRRPAFVFGPYLLRGGVDFVLAAVTAVPVALVALAAYGLGTSSGAVTFNSLLQSHTPDEVRGRVFASFDLL
ncbi:MAG: transporter, partial [Pseudonocardia sp.]|nr:transporter [Pseudonocardia sp.]